MIQHTKSVKCHVNQAISHIDVHIGGPVTFGSQKHVQI